MANNNSAQRKKTGLKSQTLGIYTKSSPPPLKVAKTIRQNRLERFELLATARSLFMYRGTQEGLKYAHDWHRTAKCMYINISQVGIYKSIKHGKAFYKGLMACGSVWSCPVCTAKIQERRRLEIGKAVAWAYSNKLQTAMVTLTFPHYKNNNLADLVKKQADALKRFRQGAPWQRFKQKVGFTGLIRSLELTFGDNGWHPHTHELWLVSSAVSVEAEREFIVARWLRCCIAAGLVNADNAAQIAAFAEHSVDIKDRCDASDYLAKNDNPSHWGVDRELAKAATKAGKASGLHVFGLLALARDGDKVAGQKFVEFCEIMKGKRQLFWSAGLKKLVKINEMTDEEIAAKTEDSADFLSNLTQEQWQIVRRAKIRGHLLNAAETGGIALVIKLIEEAEKLLKNAESGLALAT